MGSSGARWSTALRTLVHPATTGAFALLAVNDHILKPRYPGLITGKLSDFAGLAGVTLALQAVIRKPRLVLLLVSGAFIALKVVPGTAEVLAPALGGVAGRDASDLVALTVVPICVYWAPGSPAGPSLRLAGRVVGCMAMASALLATTATSCATPTRVDGFSQAGDGKVYAHVKDEVYDDAGNPVPASIWAMSSDGGATFRRVDEPPPGDVSTATTACGERCYRVRDSRVEEQLPDGEWTTSFAFTREQLKRMDRHNAGGCGTEDGLFAAVTVLQRPDGEHVVVAMGEQGILHHTPSGDWERRPVLDRRPVSLWGPSWLSQLAVAPLALPVLGLALFVLGWRRHALDQGVAALAICAAAWICLGALAGAAAFWAIDYTIYGPAVAALSVAAFVATLVLAISGRLPGAGRRRPELRED